MDNKSKNTTPNQVNPPDLSEVIKSATPLTPLQLNSFKLDIKHTLLTPQYLENLQKS